MFFFCAMLFEEIIAETTSYVSKKAVQQELAVRKFPSLSHLSATTKCPQNW
jgi:hypothetical protein